MKKMMLRRKIVLTLAILAFGVALGNAQNMSKASKETKTLLAEAQINAGNFPISEAKVRQAKAMDQDNSDISYNFGNLYLENNEIESAKLRLIEAIESTEDKSLKHKSYHNLGNTFMKEEQYQFAVEAYKDALRNNPTDEETRYNLAYAKSKLKDEKNDGSKDGDDKEDKSQDKKEDESKENKDKGDNEDKEKDDKNKDQEEDKGDQNENKEDQKDKEGDKGKQEKEQEGDGGKDEQKQPPQPQNKKGQISPEQIERLLEAIENQEKDVQEKLNAQKAKGQKSKTGKDW
jgi:tetratricopeptide (TPR) repeat protein